MKNWNGSENCGMIRLTIMFLIIHIHWEVVLWTPTNHSHLVITMLSLLFCYSYQLWIKCRKYNHEGELKVQTLFLVATLLASSETYCKFRIYKPYVQIHILVIKRNVGKLKWGCKSTKYFFRTRSVFF